MSINQTIKDVMMIPIHKEGHVIIACAVFVASLLFFIWGVLGMLGLVVAAFCTYFFRNPDRMVPQSDAVVVSSGDGVISHIGQSPAPKELGLGDAPLTKISIFLNVFNVHVNRVPVGGTITHQHYIKGLFLNASLDKASDDNERNIMAIETAAGDTVIFSQIAGLVARRIVCSTKQGQSIQQGERYGIIKFGSRCDIYLPLHYQLTASIGQTCVGGETILAINPASFNATALNWKRI